MSNNKDHHVYKQIEDILSRPYQWVFIPENIGFSCYIVEFPGCGSQGDTLEKAHNNLYGAAISWLWIQVEQNVGIPPPKGYDDWW